MGFSGDSRPDAKIVQEQLSALAEDGYGRVITVKKVLVFFKKTPCQLEEDILDKHGVSKDQYYDAFVNGSGHSPKNLQKMTDYLKEATQADIEVLNLRYGYQIEPVLEPVLEPALEPVVEPVLEPVLETVLEPVLEELPEE